MHTIITTERGTGYSLVEVMIAISILMIAIVGPLTIAAKSLQTAQYARQQTTAFFLAQEGITAVNAIRNEYALRAYNDGGVTNPWAWASGVTTPAASTLVADCFSNVGCDIDFIDDTLMDNDVACTGSGSANLCTIKLRDATGGSNPNVTALYTHQSFAVQITTPYTRIIKLTRIGTTEVQVVVEVSWDTTYLGGTRQNVTLRTSLFNIYEDL
jgi:Tfp pilus assembly protein PilV